MNFLDRTSWSGYALGIIFALFAFLLKQTAVFIGLAFAISLLLFRKKNLNTVLIGFLPLLILTSVLAAFLLGILPVNTDNILMNKFLDSIFHPNFDVVQKLGFYIINTALSIGLFIFPLTLPVILRIIRRKKFSRLHAIVLSGVFLISVFLILLKFSLSGKYMPFSGNTVYDIGIGPVVLTGIEQNELPGVPKAGVYFWLFISFIGASGFIAFLYIFFLNIKHFTHSVSRKEMYTVSACVFSISISGMFILPFLFVNANTKYLTAILPFVIIAAFSNAKILEEKLSISWDSRYKYMSFLFVPLLLFGIFATHDYFSWQRTRWKALNYLTHGLKVPPEEIDGGFEFNEWHFSHIYVWKMTDDENKKGRFWYVKDDKYIVTVKNIKGYKVLNEYRYQRCLPFGKYPIYILKRSDS